MSRAFWQACIALVGFSAMASAQALPAQSRGQWVEQQVDTWYDMARRMAPGRWGVAVADQSGNLLWSLNADSTFVPASTVKLLTTGFARSVVGSEAVLNTRVRGAGSVDATGAWIGHWALELNGDVTLERMPGTGPQLSELAQQLRARGITTLRGPLTLVSESGPPVATWPSAWSTRHRGRSFAPLVGPLMFHENLVVVGVTPSSKLGGKAVITSVAPRGLEALVSVRATTGKGRRSRLALTPRADGGWVVSGSIGSRVRGRTLVATMTRPEKVLEVVWARALADAGITWDRTAAAQPTSQPPAVLATVHSPIFDSVASEVNRRSLNSGAELLLLWAGGETGPARLTAHVASITGMPEAVALVDGSGLSYHNRATPRLFTTYLARFPHTPAGRGFTQLLPANGSGTLYKLASGLPAAGVVRAKTGTLADVSNVVGYLGRPNGVLLVSVFYEGRRASSARQAQWRLFRMLGADGVSVPADTFADGDAALGSGDAHSTPEPGTAPVQ
jgi:PBP4 family serine-type D-alanyl-D-alanine carboxypeptidase